MPIYRAKKKVFVDGTLYTPGKRDTFETDKPIKSDAVEEIKKAPAKKKVAAKKEAPPMPDDVQGVKMKTQDINFEE